MFCADCNFLKMHGIQVMAHSYLRSDVNSQMRILLNILSFYDTFIQMTSDALYTCTQGKQERAFQFSHENSQQSRQCPQ